MEWGFLGMMISGLGEADLHLKKSQSRISLQSPHHPSLHKYTRHHGCPGAATLHEPRLLHVSVDRSEKA